MTGPKSNQHDGFGQPVTREPRLSDQVSERMLDAILSRQLEPGNPLPSERELGDQFGVSRTVIREAVRSLTAKGVVNSLPGRGLIVTAMDPKNVSSSMSLYLRGRKKLPYERIHEVRSALEVDVAGLAAERAGEEDLATLREAYEQMGRSLDDVEVASKADVHFHRTIAKSTDNELFLIMLDSIGEVLLEIRRATLGLPNDAQRGQDEHREILEAIAGHDPDAARTAMRTHLRSAFEIWKTLGLDVNVDDSESDA